MKNKKHKSKAKYWHDKYYEALKIAHSNKVTINKLKNEIAENQQAYNLERLEILNDKKGVYL